MSLSDRTPGIAEQIPGAAEPVASFQDGVGQLRVAFVDSVRCADTGDARAHDQHIEIFL